MEGTHSQRCIGKSTRQLTRNPAALLLADDPGLWRKSNKVGTAHLRGLGGSGGRAQRKRQGGQSRSGSGSWGPFGLVELHLKRLVLVLRTLGSACVYLSTRNRRNEQRRNAGACTCVQAWHGLCTSVEEEHHTNGKGDPHTQLNSQVFV